MPSKKNVNPSVFDPVLSTHVFKRLVDADSELVGRRAEIVVYGGDLKKAHSISELKQAPAWQREYVRDKPKSVQTLAGEEGPLYLVVVAAHKSDEREHEESVLTESPYAVARDLAGHLLRSGFGHSDALRIKFVQCDGDVRVGFLVGLGLGLYRYKRVVKSKPFTPKLRLLGVTTAQLEQARLITEASLVARHLVNLPAAELGPSRYADSLRELFSGNAATKVEVWDVARLKKEGMGLHVAVGQGAADQPCLVRISYRPGGKTRAPVAFVGKGITFDSGGLDIKPPPFMRNMKKDMGGSAAVVGLAHYVVQAGLKKPFEFYLALAENAVDSHSFRPGDILTARNGKRVEIDNTDAEGRLVMGDALCVAVAQKEKPRCVIDVATLTGAVKVGLGADIPGLFSNSDKIADKILVASQKMGEPVWRLPLVHRYKKMLRSQVADLVNSAASRFAGAITAALFLEEFTDDVPWAHLDIYGWTDGPQGPYVEAGGTGQMVQLLVALSKTI